MTDAIPTRATEPERAGLSGVYEDGKEAYRLTAEGKQVAQQMALSSEDDPQGAS